MSRVIPKNSKVKKLQDSFSEDSDKHDDTELQTPQIFNHQRAFKESTKTQVKQTKVQKNEQDKKKSSKNQPIKKNQLKTFQEDEKLQPSRSRKYEGVKSIKDFAQDDNQQKIIDPSKNSKKNRNNKIKEHEKMQENEKRAHQIIEKLDQVYDEDVELYKQGKPADRKLKYILEIQKKLKQIELAKSFLDMDGHLVFIDWLLPNPETRQETSLTVKIHVFKILADMRFTKENIEAGQELVKMFKKYRKSRYEILRNLSASIVQKWKIFKALPNA